MPAVNKRRLELDYAKGLAILLLIISHCMQDEGALKTWIFSFHMPIFFVICGVLQSMKHPDGITAKQVPAFLKHRAYQLLVPYFFFGAVLIAFFQGLHLLAGEPLTLQTQLFALISLQGIESMWFLPVYMIAELLFVTVFLKLPRTVRACIVLAGVIILAFLSERGMPEFFVLQTLLRVLVGLIFIYMGYCVERYSILARIPSVVALVGMALCCVGALKNGFAAIGSLQLQNVFLFFLTGGATSIFILVLFQKITKTQVTLSWLSYWGRNTLVVLCTNNLLIEIVRLLDYKVTGNFFLNNGIVGSFSMAVVIAMLEMFAIWISNSKCKVLFGK